MLHTCSQNMDMGPLKALFSRENTFALGLAKLFHGKDALSLASMTLQGSSLLSKTVSCSSGRHQNQPLEKIFAIS